MAPRDLQWWSEHAWRGGIHLQALAGLERFAVRTKNTTYEITVLTPESGEVLVRGGRFFPEHTRVELAGCSLGGAFLKVRSIHAGFVMELLHNGQRIVTTPVHEIIPVVPPFV